MAREWGPTGVPDYRPPRLSGDRREHIDLILNDHDIPRSVRKNFYEAIAAAIGLYDSLVEFRANSLPSTIRANLDSALDATRNLTKALNALDGNSRQLLAECGPDDLSVLRDLRDRISVSLHNARRMADEYPDKGTDQPRLYLAEDVADAMRRELDVEPKQTRDGLYDQVLLLVMREATRKKVRSVQNLMARALKNRVKETSPSGITTYHMPPKSK